MKCRRAEEFVRRFERNSWADTLAQCCGELRAPQIGPNERHDL